MNKDKVIIELPNTPVLIADDCEFVGFTKNKKILGESEVDVLLHRWVEYVCRLVPQTKIVNSSVEIRPKESQAGVQVYCLDFRWVVKDNDGKELVICSLDLSFDDGKELAIVDKPKNRYSPEEGSLPIGIEHSWAEGVGLYVYAGNEWLADNQMEIPDVPIDGE